MKAFFKNLILFMSISLLINVNSVRFSQNNPYQKFLPSPPVGSDLQNHFGFEPNSNFYGPQSRGNVALIPREGLYNAQNQYNPITMITNYNQEIDPSRVVSGNLLNTSYDAGRIVPAIIASNLIHLIF